MLSALFMRWPEAAYISSLVSPRGHTINSAISKSDLSPPLMRNAVLPVPLFDVPTLTPLTSLS
jgi:hypothetical protein